MANQGHCGARTRLPTGVGVVYPPCMRGPAQPEAPLCENAQTVARRVMLPTGQLFGPAERAGAGHAQWYGHQPATQLAASASNSIMAATRGWWRSQVMSRVCHLNAVSRALRRRCWRTVTPSTCMALLLTGRCYAPHDHHMGYGKV
jgi:hypothetical protein